MTTRRAKPARKTSTKPDSGKAEPTPRQRIAAGQRAVAAPAKRTSVRPTGQAEPAKPARNPRTKPGQSADPASSWSPAERAAFVRATFEAGLDPEMRAALAEGARWSWVLGEKLSARIGLACLAAGEDPGGWCRQQLEDAVAELERQNARRAATAKARTKCQHPDKDRRGLRCGACGARGLPAT